MVDEWNPESSFNAVQEAFDELGTMCGGVLHELVLENNMYIVGFTSLLLSASC